MTMTTNAVTLKLPEFWESSALAWFAQTEPQFVLGRSQQSTTKYYYVVSALGNSTAIRVLSLLNNPPATEKYKAVKAHLLKTFDMSDAARASRLIPFQGLGDSKPSELMDCMLYLLSQHGPVFIQLFLRQLPSQVRASLANTTITDCWRLAEEADTFFLPPPSKVEMVPHPLTVKSLQEFLGMVHFYHPFILEPFSSCDPRRRP